MANGDLKVDDVDEMFESFVKKKLKQLGIKREASRTVVNDDKNVSMTELERSMKLRLEQNHGQRKRRSENSEALYEEINIDNKESTPPKAKKNKKNKKEKKKKKKRKEGKDKGEKKTDTNKDKKDKKRKSEKNGGSKSKHKLNNDSDPKKSAESRIENSGPKHKITDLNEAENAVRTVLIEKGATNGADPSNGTVAISNVKTPTNDKVIINIISTTGPTKVDDKVTSKNDIDIMTTETIKLNCDKTIIANVISTMASKNDVATKTRNTPTTGKIETAGTTGPKNDVATKIITNGKIDANVATGPKKDIATIKMKIELLKAKSQGDRLREQMNGLLKQTTEKEGDKNSLTEADTKKKTVSKSRSRSPKKSTKRSKHHSRHKSRSRSRSRSRRRSRSHSKHRRSNRSRSNSRGRHKRSRSRDRHRRHSRKRSRRSRSPLISSKDKVRLLEIAKVNALAQHKASYMATSISAMGQMLKSNNMSVKQLTDICKDISIGNESISANTGLTKEGAEKLLEEVQAANLHHPFAVRETPISFNIKPLKMSPAPPLVSKPLATLTKEFPVSCGQQHRRKEVLETVYGKWQAVAKDAATKNAVKELVTSDKVFIETEPEVDLTSAIANRISAARLLQDNPESVEANTKMSTAQKQLDSWTKARQVPGQFTGSTALHAMPRAVLEGGKQAWFKPDELKNAKHVEGIGKSLLQKMGWTPGTPLGKTMLGELEPLSLNFKTDRRGLSSFMEVNQASQSKKTQKNSVGGENKNQSAKDLSGKHPVSALMEICSKRRWSAPDFRLADPCDIKSFTYRVKVCNDEYIGKPANNKKEAKLKAATVALQCMGLLPKT